MSFLYWVRTHHCTGAFKRLLLSFSFTACFFITYPAAAQVCIFPQTYEACSGADCITDFESTSDSGAGANSSVNLDERRALAQAGGGAAERAATAFVGVRIEPERTTDVEISTLGTYSGVIQGGLAPTSFGRVLVWTGLWNLTTDDIEVQLEVLQEQEDDNNITVLPVFPLDALTANFEATLVEGNEYAVFFRVETTARGLTSNSDFRTGGRGVFFDRMTIQPTSEFADADGDALFDFWEEDGVIDCNDNLILDLPGLGATPDHKDIFIEYDWLPGWDPVESSITAVKDAFEVAPIDAGGVANPDGEEGIRLWIDTGNPATGDDLGGGGEIDPMDTPNGLNVSKFAGDADGNNVIDYYDVKRQYFDENRRFAFHYLINGGTGTQEQGAGAGSCSDGIDNDGDGLVDSDDIINCFRNSQAELGGNDIYMSVRGSGILMHELGHNLGLSHGGDEGLNCKPNYVSVMNYNMQNGIPQDSIAGQDIDADGIPDNRIVDYSPARFPGGRGAAPLQDLDETDLDENVILDPTDSENMTVFIDSMGVAQTTALDSTLDWAGDGNPPFSMSVSANINSGPASGCSGNPAGEDPYSGHDDWSNIEMNFRLDSDFRDAPNNPTEEPEPSQEELDDLLEAIYTTDLRIEKT
ncbi:MAG: hypothetical protein KTR29_16710, partial [Rhodothermaceae bacterium]|nr:hypothetical protein [Rhodothermaceae bacterium]